MAELFELTQCKQDTKEFILENFVPVAESEDFVEISKELLCELLASNDLRASSELDVFTVALKWLGASPEKAEHARSVLSLVRYGLMNAEQVYIIREIGMLTYIVMLFEQLKIVVFSQILSTNKMLLFSLVGEVIVLI